MTADSQIVRRAKQRHCWAPVALGAAVFVHLDREDLNIMKPATSLRSILVAGSLFLAIAVSSAGSDTKTFSPDAAILDKDIPEAVRKAFDDDDGKPMKSVSVDLNNDKIPEKLIPNQFLCGNGGCPWLVYSPKLKKVIGRLFGNTIVILDTSTEGYKQIHTSWSLGADETGSAVYKFKNGAYEQEK